MNHISCDGRGISSSSPTKYFASSFSASGRRVGCLDGGGRFCVADDDSTEEVDLRHSSPSSAVLSSSAKVGARGEVISPELLVSRNAEVSLSHLSPP